MILTHTDACVFKTIDVVLQFETFETEPSQKWINKAFGENLIKNRFKNIDRVASSLYIHILYSNTG